MLHVFLTLPWLLIASAAWAQEPELLADVPAAEAAGFTIVDLRNRPDDPHSGLVRQLVAEYARSHGITRTVAAD